MKEVLDIKIAIVILSILLFLSIAALVIVGLFNCKLVRDIANPILYPCDSLFVILNFNQEENKVITDLSRYEEEKIAMQIINLKEPPVTEEEKFRDGKMAILSPAVLYEIDGKFLWEY